MGIFVEIDLATSISEVWRLTQEPALHQRWDLRFTGIEYLPRPDERQPQRFAYSTRIGFGLAIRGAGETVATREDAQGCRTSSLRFWSDDPASLIREGSGYWQYRPLPEGVRFLTWYDYQTRFGLAGRLVDRLVFRPLIGWATAWSFDRLRLWLERGLDPGLLLRQFLVYALARLAIASIWLYQGLVPKLITQHPDEVALIAAAGLPPAITPTVLLGLGLAELALGLMMLIRWPDHWPLWFTAGLMVAATGGVALTAPGYLGAAFNPVSLNLAVMTLAVIALISRHDLPSARRCRRQPRKEA